MFGKLFIFSKSSKFITVKKKKSHLRLGKKKVKSPTKIKSITSGWWVLFWPTVQIVTIWMEVINRHTRTATEPTLVKYIGHTQWASVPDDWDYTWFCSHLLPAAGRGPGLKITNRQILSGVLNVKYVVLLLLCECVAYVLKSVLVFDSSYTYLHVKEFHIVKNLKVDRR